MKHSAKKQVQVYAMSRTQLTLQVSVVLILTMGTNSWAQDSQTFHKFKLVENSNMDTVINDQHSQTPNDVVVFYSWTSKGHTRYLGIHSMMLKSLIDGKEIMNDDFSRKKIAKTKDGSTYELGPDQITGPMKTVVQDSFDTLLCKLEINRSGTDFKRTMEAGPGANMIIQKGIVDDRTSISSALSCWPERVAVRLRIRHGKRWLCQWQIGL